MILLKSTTVSVSMQSPAKKVYAFVSKPANLPKWARTFIQSIKKLKGEWIAQTAQGPVQIRIVGKNNFGILDHYVSPAPGVEVFVPMRVVSNGKGSEVIFTVFQSPNIPDEKYAEDIAMVKEDLENLKSVMEDV